MEHEKKDDVIEFKIPKFTTEKIRKNPWIISTLVFVVLSLVLIWNNYSGLGFASGSVSETTAGENLVKFLEDNAGVQVTLTDISSANGLYKIDVDYQGSPVTLYMTKDGDYLIQSLTPLTADSDNTGNQNYDEFLLDSSIYPSLGPDDAKTTVIEFADFQCPFCGLASGLPSWASQYQSQYGDLVGSAGKIEELAQQGKIKFVYVPMNFLGQGSTYASEAGLCANEQGKFWEIHDEIFRNQVTPQEEGKQFTKAQLEDFAKKISGLDFNKFKTCLEDDKYLDEVKGIAQTTSGIGTPRFIVNGKEVDSSWAKIQSAIGV